jgi:putative transposase
MVVPAENSVGVVSAGLTSTLGLPVLDRQLQFVIDENRLLRDRLRERIMTTPAERARLLKYGRPLGSAINQLTTIVAPGTSQVRNRAAGLRVNGHMRANGPKSHKP